MSGLDDDDCERMTPSRRAVLGAAGLLFSASFVPKFAYAAAGSRDPRFLLVILRGGLDGMAAVPPLGDPNYQGLREGIALQKEGADAALPLDGFFCLHPAMPNLARLYAQRQASIVHAVATGYRERSHFDGQDVLESGQNGPGLTESGWLNRMIAALPAGEGVGRRGVLGIGVVPPLVVRGGAPVLGWAPPRMPRAGEDLMLRLQDLYRSSRPGARAGAQPGHRHRDGREAQRHGRWRARQCRRARQRVRHAAHGRGCGQPDGRR